MIVLIARSIYERIDFQQNLLTCTQCATLVELNIKHYY